MTGTRTLRGSEALSTGLIELLAIAAADSEPIRGWTHSFYRYPARFSPRFAATAIELFSRPADLVLDPYMGGGTTVVEGMVLGRRVVGNDLNSLAAFISSVKTTRLNQAEVSAVRDWANNTIDTLSYRTPVRDLIPVIDPVKTRNLTLDRARYIKKAIAAALVSIEALPSAPARNFAKAALLRVGQWALDGRRSHTALSAFRHKLHDVVAEMLEALRLFRLEVRRSGGSSTILNHDAADLAAHPFFRTEKASLVVTSPPYPGVHVLYHRWQVDGRRESPAPYWITGCEDGRGASYYNFGDRRQAAADRYFRNSLGTLIGIRGVMSDGAFIVQMLAFNRPAEQLPQYLANMSEAGFAELPAFSKERIWRDVPNRKWHATLRGPTDSAREVVLVHQAV